MNKITIKIIFSFFVLNIFLSLTPDFALAENSVTRSNSKEETVEVEWGDRAEIIDHPVYGVIVLSKDRWKNWVFRSLIIIMAYLSLLIVILSIPKTSELNLIVAYILSGSAFVVSFWETLSGWMLTRLNSYKYGWSFILISIPMYLASYFAVIRVKKNDISYSQIKEEFKKMQQLNADSYEDSRLLPISGVPGDWEDEDFVRHR
ncbi:MAG: hypothetical protein AB1602_06660 [Elusimicrobiota bacterium]